jgi:hypothetical protein
MFCRPVILCVLNCITDTMELTEGRKYFPWGIRGPPLGQPWATKIAWTRLWQKIQPSAGWLSSGWWFLVVLRREKRIISICRNVGYVIQRENRETWDFSLESYFYPLNFVPSQEVCVVSVYCSKHFGSLDHFFFQGLVRCYTANT